MSEMATPRPWKLVDKAGNKHYRNAADLSYESVMQHCWYIAGPMHDSDFVADLITARDLNGNANAELAVRAVNAHDDLVAALKDVRRALANSELDNSDVFYPITVIDAALAKAEGTK